MHSALQAILPHRTTGEIRDYLKANQDDIQRQIPPEAWMLCDNGVPLWGEVKPGVVFALHSKVAGRGFRSPINASEQQELGARPMVRAGPSGSGQLSKGPAMPLGSFGSRPKPTDGRNSGGLPAALKTGNKAPVLIPHDIFEGNAVYASRPAKPERMMLNAKPAAQQVPRLAVEPSRAAPEAPLKQGSSLPGSALASTAVRSSSLRTELAEAAAPGASTSLPPGFSKSGPSTAHASHEAPEVQSPMKARRPSIPGLPSSKQVGPTAAEANRHDRSHRRVELQASKGLAHMQRRASEPHRAGSDSRHKLHSRRSSSPWRHAQKRSRSPSAASRSDSRDRGGSHSREQSIQPRNDGPAHRPRVSEPAGHRSSRSPGRSQEVPAGNRELTTDHAKRPRQQQFSEHPAASAGAAAPAGDISRPLSAREICEGISRAPAPVLPANNSSLVSHSSSPRAPPLPSGLAHQHSSSASRGLLGTSKESAPDADPPARCEDRRPAVEPYAAPAERPGRDARPAAPLPSSMRQASGGVPAQSAKTARIGATMSMLDMGAKLMEKARRDGSKVGAWQPMKLAYRWCQRQWRLNPVASLQLCFLPMKMQNVYITIYMDMQNVYITILLISSSGLCAVFAFWRASENIRLHCLHYEGSLLMLDNALAYPAFQVFLYGRQAKSAFVDQRD